jgi:hypothetical protein
MSKTQRVETALRKAPLTAAQISTRFKVPNVRAMIYDLKRKGLDLMKIEGTGNKATRWAVA